ncbi:MAG TPA: hypothetical protein VIH21_09190 [Dehalococcoidia bacterium]
MTLNPVYSTRSLSLLLVAAFAGMALWLFLPWDRAGSGWSDSGDAALPPSLRVDGAVEVTSNGNIVTRLVVPLALRGDEGISLGDAGTIRAETFMSESAAAAVPATYSVAWLDGNGDQILDSGEHAVLTVNLPERSSVHPANPLRLVIHPVGSVALVIEDVLQ